MTPQLDYDGLLAAAEARNHAWLLTRICTCEACMVSAPKPIKRPIAVPLDRPQNPVVPAPSSPAPRYEKRVRVLSDAEKARRNKKQNAARKAARALCLCRVCGKPTDRRADAKMCHPCDRLDRNAKRNASRPKKGETR